MSKLSQISIAIVTMAALAGGSTAYASTIGNWTGSSRSWNHFDFVTILVRHLHRHRPRRTRQCDPQRVVRRRGMLRPQRCE